MTGEVALWQQKMKANHTQATEEALMDMLNIGHAATSAGLKDALYPYVENDLTELDLKGLMNASS